MAIVYVGANTPSSRAGATSAISVNFAFNNGNGETVPIAGDLVIVTSVVSSAGRTPAQAVTTPTGYTALTQLNANGTTYDTSICVSYKFMGATPDTSVTIPGTGNNADAQSYTIQCLRGVDPNNPLDVAVATATGTGTSLCNPPSITPTTSGAWVTTHNGGAAAVTTTQYTTTGLSNVRQTGGADTNSSRALCSADSWTSGAFDPAVFGAGSNNAADSWASYSIAWRPLPAISTLTEGFGAALDTTNKWTVTLDTTSTQTVTGGTLNLTCTGTDQFAFVTTKGFYDLTGSSVYAKLVQGATNGGENGADAQFILETTNGSQLAFWVNSNSIATLGYKIGGTSTGVATLTYDPAVHTWLRFRETGGTIYWDTAPATASNPPIEADWVNRGSLLKSTFTPGTHSFKCSLNSTTWTAASNNTVKWDGLNTSATVAATHATTGVLTPANPASVTSSPSHVASNAISTLTDSFSGTSLDTSKWTTFNTGTGQTVTQNNELILDPNGDNAAINHVGVRSTNNYNISGSSAYVRLVQRLQTTGDDWGFSETWFGLEHTANDEGFGFVLTKSGDLVCRIWNDIGDNWAVDKATVTGFTDGTWLRLRHDSTSGGTIYWDTAPDNSGVPGTWTNRASELTSNLVFDDVNGFLGNAKACLRTGFWDNTMSDSFITGPAKFDGFNSSTAGVVTHGTTAVLAPGSASATGSAARFRAMSATGALATGQASLTGSAGRSAGAVTHTSTGVLAASNGPLAGSAARFRAHGTSGALEALLGPLAGSTARFRAHGTTATLAAPKGALAGSNTRTAPAAGNAFSNLTDSFTSSTLDEAKWTFTNVPDVGGGSAGTYDITSGRLRLYGTTADAYDSDAFLISDGTWSLASSHVRARISANTSLDRIEMGIRLISASRTKWLMLAVAEGNFYATGRDGDNWFLVDSNQTYDPVNHAWFQIRESSGTVYWEAAPDVSGSPGTFSVLASYPTASVPFSLTDMNLVLHRRVLSLALPSTSDGIVFVDAVNTSASHVVTNHAATAALSAGNARLAGTSAAGGVSNIKDGFDAPALDTLKWTPTVSQGTGTITQADGRLKMNLTSGAQGDQLLVTSVGTGTLLGSGVFARLSQAVFSTSNGPGIEAALDLTAAGGNYVGWHQQSNGVLEAQRMNGGTVVDAIQFSYTPFTHAWLRIKEDGGQVYWQTADANASDPPQEGQWTTRYQLATSSIGFSLTSVSIRFMVQVWSAQSGVPTQAAEWDCINTQTRTLQAHATSGALAAARGALAGAASKKVLHASTGVLTTRHARTAAASTHAFEHHASGALAAGSATISANSSTSDVTRKVWVDTQDTAGAWSEPAPPADPWTLTPDAEGSWGS